LIADHLRGEARLESSQKETTVAKRRILGTKRLRDQARRRRQEEKERRRAERKAAKETGENPPEEAGDVQPEVAETAEGQQEESGGAESTDALLDTPTEDSRETAEDSEPGDSDEKGGA